MSEPSPVVELADILARKAIDGWARLIWRATLYGGGTFEERLEVILESGAVADAATTAFRMGLVMDPRGRAVVDQLGAALAAVDGGDRHAVELTVEPGRVDAVVSTALTQSTGYLPPTYQVVVDASRMTRREPDDAGETMVAEGDTRRAVELAELYDELYAEIMGERLGLRPPATENEIASAEAALGVMFPPDLRALYRMADGEDGNYGLFGGPTFLPLASVVERWQENSTPEDNHNHVTIEADPPGTIRAVSRHPRWIPFADHNDGNMFAVDLAPGPRGTAGQVIEYGSDHDDEPVSHVAGSVTDLLAELVAMLRAGDVDTVPGESFWIFPAYTKGETPDYSRRVTPGQDWIAALPDPGHVQELLIHDAGTVDLSPLAALPRLRILRVQDGVTVTGLDALRSCPLELLDITARQLDLTGHPTLRILSVRGVEDCGCPPRSRTSSPSTCPAARWPTSTRSPTSHRYAISHSRRTSGIGYRSPCTWPLPR